MTVSTPFDLDTRIAASSREWAVLDKKFQLRLADDSRWPWLLLVPLQADLVELDDMNAETLALMMDLASSVARALRLATGCPKTNVATIGNVVAQFHLHVVARQEGDPNWPNPIWGHGQAVPYTDEEADNLRSRFDAAWQGLAE